MDLKSRKILGLLFIGIGMVLIFFAIMLKAFDISESFIGFYLGPLGIMLGAGFLVAHKE